jgi:mRNA interferase RelE/StbE
MKLELGTRATKALSKLEHSLTKSIIEELEFFARTHKSAAVKKLKGTQCLWRLKVGDYRAVFEIIKRPRGEEDIVYVLFIEHRKDVYRHL